MIRHASLMAGLYALAGGAVSFAGWILDIPRLADWDNTGIAIQPNATLCAAFAGIAVLSLTKGWQRAARGSAAIVLFLGGLTFIEWTTGFSFGIDTWFLFDRQFGRVGVVHPGRMGPPGSLAWTLLGLALLLTTRAGRARRLAPALALVPLMIALLSLVGYLYGADALYSLPTLTVIASQTSSVVLAVSLGVLLCSRDLEPVRTMLDPGGAGALARRVLPLLVILPIALGYYGLRGERAGWFDTAFRTAMLVLALISVLAALFWRALYMVRAREREAFESAARERARATLLQTVLDTSPAPIWVATDPECQHITGNPAGDATLGAPDGANVSRSAVDGEAYSYRVLRDGNEVSVEMLPMQRAAREGQPVAAEELEVVRGDGSRVWLHMHASPLREGDEVRGAVSVAVDITARKVAEAALRESARRKDEFLATLAHELRNPLAPIRNALSLLTVAPMDRAVQESAVAMMHRQVHQMVRLIDDLMDVGRITQGKLSLRIATIELGLVVQQAVENSRPLADAARHAMALDLPEETIWLEGDRVRLTQVLTNLLNNACKFTPEGGVISVRVEREGSDAVIRVTDSGIGLPAGSEHAVFDAFFQLDHSLEKSHGGLGVGLTLARRLVELHHGSVTARSEGPGRGTEFVVRLPLLVRHAPAPPAEEWKADGGGAGRRILVVDDNRDIADSLAMLLRLSGEDAHTAYDGAAALEMADRLRPDVVLLDIGMPKLNGYDTCRAIRNRSWGVTPRIVALTGWGQEEDRERAFSAGFDGHLVKPVEPAALSELLNAPGRA